MSAFADVLMHRSPNLYFARFLALRQVQKTVAAVVRVMPQLNLHPQLDVNHPVGNRHAQEFETKKGKTKGPKQRAKEKLTQLLSHL